MAGLSIAQVEEVIFMNKLTVEDLKITLQMRLAEVDRRIQLGRQEPWYI